MNKTLQNKSSKFADSFLSRTIDINMTSICYQAKKLRTYGKGYAIIRFFDLFDPFVYFNQTKVLCDYFDHFTHSEIRGIYGYLRSNQK